MYHAYPNFGPSCSDPNFTYAGPFINENFYDLSIPAENTVEQKIDNEQFVESWLLKRGKLTPLIIPAPETPIEPTPENPTEPTPEDLNEPPPESPTEPIKVGNIQNSVSKCATLIEELEETRKFMSENIDLPPEEWKNKFFQASALRLELQACLVYLQKPPNFTAAKAALSKRRKKRLNQKKRRAELKKIRALRMEETDLAHKEIDQWLEGMKDNVERVKAEEEMKKEADLVLGEVTKKKSEARKQLSLINTLVKLRNIRHAAATHRGDKLSLEDQSAFNKTTDRLISMWENAMQVYKKEEQGLKIMLEQTAELKSKITGSKDRVIYQQWERVLFGQNHAPDSMCWMLSAAERDFEAFIDIRKRWDNFLCEEEGSKIPVGWVSPGAIPGTSWDEYLQN